MSKSKLGKDKEVSKDDADEIVHPQLATPELATPELATPELEPEAELAEPEVESQSHPALLPALQPASTAPQSAKKMDRAYMYALGAGAVVALGAMILLIPSNSTNPIAAALTDGRLAIKTSVLNSVKNLRSRTLQNHLTGAPGTNLASSKSTAPGVQADDTPTLLSRGQSEPQTGFQPGSGPAQQYAPKGAPGGQLTVNNAFKPKNAAGPGAALGAAAANGAAAQPGQKGAPTVGQANLPENLKYPAGAPKTNPGTGPTSLPVAGGVPPPKPDLAERLPKYYGTTGSAATATTFGGGTANAAMAGAQAAGAVGAAGLLAMGDLQNLKLEHAPPPVGKDKQVVGQEAEPAEQCNPLFEDINPAWVSAPKEPTYVQVIIDSEPTGTGKGVIGGSSGYLKAIPPPPLPPMCIPKPPPPAQGGSGGSGGSS
ncbi:MAG: hypothetical protein HY078_07065 [Elusimicrobia bacterium]|nr:hypothetical protein [Elusimicrobiota bacterium]